MDTCWILHPELKVTQSAHRKALASAANRRIGKTNGPSSSSAQLAQDSMFFADFDPPDLGSSGNFGSFGGYNTEVMSEEVVIQAVSIASAERAVSVQVSEGEVVTFKTLVDTGSSHNFTF
jgi:hypothetical protein